MPVDDRQGFTLIEVLVAFAILALSLTALMQVFGTGLRNTVVSEAYVRATLLAESKLAAVGVEQPLEPGERNGDFGTAGGEDKGYRWRVVVTPFEADELVGIEPYRVSVTVSWGPEHQTQRSVTLNTLRLRSKR